jgi:peptidoglycan hydrolase CwlO-like protein
MQSYVAKKEKELKQTERRFQDKVEIVEKLNKEREELDKLNTTLKNKVASLELEIKTRRAEFDNQRRLLSDRVSNLDT